MISHEMASCSTFLHPFPPNAARQVQACRKAPLDPANQLAVRTELHPPSTPTKPHPQEPNSGDLVLVHQPVWHVGHVAIQEGGKGHLPPAGGTSLVGSAPARDLGAGGCFKCHPAGPYGQAHRAQPQRQGDVSKAPSS